MISEFFNQFLYRPLLNLLVILCLFLPTQNFGAAIILLTVSLKALLLPLTIKSIESRDSLAEMKPKMEEIQKKFKDDKTKQAEELKSLYEKYDINPFGSFMPLLIQFPILIALYRVFLQGFDKSELYDFVSYTGNINYSFFGVNLTTSSVILSGLAIIIYFIQLKSSMKNSKNNSMKGFQKFLPYFFSAFTFIILIKIPAAVSLYIATSSLFALAQRSILQKNES